ncbi:hypothetical protein BDV12DRAFT_182817 [Aspergillus spectabilis]
MHISVLSLSLLLAGQGLAAHQVSSLSGTALSKRQGGDSFTPDTVPGCPDDWPMCGTSGICYSPPRGDTCCPGGTYACPGGSFCLQDGYCCPDGQDRETCARDYGITLDPTTTAEPTTSTSFSSSTSSTSTPVIPTSSESSTTTPSPTSSPTVPPTDPPMHTGGASAKIVGGAAAVLGGLGMLGNLLV